MKRSHSAAKMHRRFEIAKRAFCGILRVDMTRNLFAYGTLLVPEIWEAVAGESFHTECATLKGFNIRRVKGAEFPGITPGDESVCGRVFFEIDELTLAKLDAYEDTFYVRQEIEAELENGSAVVADSYVVPAEVADEILSADLWTLEDYEANR